MCGETAKGQRFVVLGFGPTNIERMKAGEPIRANLHRLDPTGEPTDMPSIEVVIYFDDGKRAAPVTVATAIGQWLDENPIGPGSRKP